MFPYFYIFIFHKIFHTKISEDKIFYDEYLNLYSLVEKYFYLIEFHNII
jgi:hypothetical protein